MFGLQRPSPLRPQARMQRLNHRFAKGCLTFVGGVVEHPTNGGAVPGCFTGSGPLLGCFQTATNLSNGAAISPDPLEDLAHHAGLLPHDLKAGLSVPLLFSDVAVAVGSAPQHTHLPDLCSMPLP